MHVNYRRKKRSNHRSKHRWGYLPDRSLVDEKQIYWGEVRAAVRDLLNRGKYDAVYTRPRNSIRWDLC